MSTATKACPSHAARSKPNCASWLTRRRYRRRPSAPTDLSYAGEPRGLVGGKENGDAGDVVRLPDATKRRACDHRFLEVYLFSGNVGSWPLLVMWGKTWGAIRCRMDDGSPVHPALVARESRVRHHGP